MKNLPVVLLLLLFIAGPGWRVLCAFDGQNPSAVERQIWALEEAYVTAFKKAEHEGILALLHSRFLGWPDSQGEPIVKSEAVRYLQENHAQPAALSFEIDRAGIRVFGDVVITHYVLNITGNGAEDAGQARAIRITHTWIREGSDWKILGGMSNAQ
jgi:ketosteroid isomerase-like protein